MPFLGVDTGQIGRKRSTWCTTAEDSSIELLPEVEFLDDGAVA